LAVAAAALAAAAALLAAVWIESRAATVYAPQAVLEQATEFFGTESPQAGWRLGEAAPPAGFPLSDDVLRTPQIRWRTIRGLLGRSGVAYDLSPPGGPRATLYVVSQASVGLPGQPPSKPWPTTAGCSAAAWQQGGLLYVLVVEGGPGVYRSCLRIPSGPVA
jgi:hypothetical protein